jgi:Domain of unknown function (DUF3850)
MTSSHRETPVTARDRPVIHELKTWPVPFQAVLDGKKLYELRKNDRGYRVGDILHLREWDPDTEHYSGRSLRARVTYMTRGGEFGLPNDLCIMGLVLLETHVP